MPAFGRLFVGLAVVMGPAIDVRGGGSADMDSPEAREAITKTVMANTQFGLDLYAKLRRQEGNLFFSPYSLSTALALTYAGARGQTQGQMAATLHWCGPGSAAGPWSATQLGESLGALIQDQNRRGSQGHYELVVANALWGQKGVTFMPDFLRIIETQYNGRLHSVDFAADPEAARATINTWVEDQTRKRIQDLIPAGVLDRLTRLVLTNAIYFKGDWASPFAKDDTVNDSFHLAGGKTADVPMMRQIARYAYAESRQLQILELPYGGDELSMIILLPRKVDGLAAVEQDLTYNAVTGWLGQLRGLKEVVVTIPKFTLACQFSLGQILQSMGMTVAFAGGADFSGMTGKRDLFLSAVVHKAFVAVDEKGTEAAAATGAVMTLSFNPAKPEPLMFKADHPFFFMIRDKASGSILFFGRLMDPGKGAGSA